MDTDDKAIFIALLAAILAARGGSVLDQITSAMQLLKAAEERCEEAKHA